MVPFNATKSNHSCCHDDSFHRLVRASRRVGPVFFERMQNKVSIAMDVMLVKIAPIILVFLVGFLLKSLNVLTRKDGESLLKVFFHLSVPSLTLLSVSQMQFSLQYLWLPIIAALVILATFGVAHCMGRCFNLEQPSLGAFLVGSLAMNTSFSFPFILSAGGEQGLALASLFDFGNMALIFTFIYYLACKYGNNAMDSRAMIKKFIFSPPLAALAFALILNLSQVALPEVAIHFLQILGYMTVPLVMLSLGIYFTPVTVKVWPLTTAVLIRMVLGLGLGLIFTRLFELEGLSRMAVLLCSSAPSGITTLVFSTMEELDKELAAGIVSYSTLTGMVLVPLLLGYLE